MPMLTYERAWSRAQKRDARAFALGFARRGDACFMDENGVVPRNMQVFTDPEVVWISARDEGQVVATIATKLHRRPGFADPELVPDWVRAPLLGEFDSRYDFTALLTNIRIARVNLIDDPPGTPAVSGGFRGAGLDALQAGVFGVGSIVYDVPMAGMSDGVTVVVFPPEDLPEHFEVPYA